LLTRFRDIHFKLYTEEGLVEIVVNALDREEGVDRDIALLIADGYLPLVFQYQFHPI